MVRCIKGALPRFRKNKSGTIVNVGSSAGFFAAPACTAYAASKFAVEGISEALAREIGVFGIRVILIEPGAFRTNLVSNLKLPTSKISDYEGTPADQLVQLQLATNGKQPGDPAKGATRIVEVATNTAGDALAQRGKGEVLRVFLGTDCFNAAKAKSRTFDENLNTLEEMAKSTDFI
jgi:NAD(P)-dependent dehydrogenase (short-subunit alcohol dehydrogenase family)